LSHLEDPATFSLTVLQYNGVVVNFAPGVPEEFQKAGISALVYDPRNTGKSGGFPRNDIDPFKQSEDYHDAFIFLSQQDIINPDQIVYFGMSLSAGIALAAAAMDRRICAIIAVAPVFEFTPIKPHDEKRLKQKLMKDRESQVTNGTPPYVLPILESVAFLPFNSHITTTPEEQRQEELAYHAHLADEWKKELGDDDEFDPALTHNAYGTVMQSYHRMFLWESIPAEQIKRISPTPLFMLTPEHDQISSAESQTEIFESLQGPKRQMIAPGREHLFVLNGTDMPVFVKWMSDFVWQVVRGRFETKSSDPVATESTVVDPKELPKVNVLETKTTVSMEGLAI
jgi:pimeloyl-ACP methyl ester carboxylesterase